MSHNVPDGYAMTESERRAILAQLVAIAEKRIAGVLSLEDAQRQAQRVMQPFKRRLRRRIRHQARMALRGQDLLDGV